MHVMLPYVVMSRFTGLSPYVSYIVSFLFESNFALLCFAFHSVLPSRLIARCQECAYPK